MSVSQLRYCNRKCFSSKNEDQNSVATAQGIYFQYGENLKILKIKGCALVVVGFQLANILSML